MKKVKVRDLKRGDILTASRAKVVNGPAELLNTPKGQVTISIQYPDGRLKIQNWGKYTEVTIDEPAIEENTITKDEVETWIKEPIWISYAMKIGEVNKKLQIAVGMPGFRVLHGKEIVYEGPSLANAIEAYKAITTIPDLNQAPKLDN